MAKVILKGYVIVPDADLEAVKKELVNHIRLTRQEKGCLVFNVSQDSQNLNKFDVYEEFVDQDSFALHQDRTRDSEWGAIAAHVVRHYEEPKIG